MKRRTNTIPIVQESLNLSPLVIPTIAGRRYKFTREFLYFLGYPPDNHMKILPLLRKLAGVQEDDENVYIYIDQDIKSACLDACVIAEVWPNQNQYYPGLTQVCEGQEFPMTTVTNTVLGEAIGKGYGK